MPKIIIKIENLLIALIAIWLLYNSLSYPASESFLSLKNWYLVVLIWISFDLSALGYLINKKIGSYLYNLIHNYILAIILFFLSAYLPNNDLLIIALILTSHVAIDRVLGYGLKYESGFKDTHIQKL